MLRACASRAGIGAWRSRKQVIWLLALMALFFVMYIQLSPSFQMSVEGPAVHKRHHPNSVYQSGEEKSSDQMQRVKFLSNGISAKKDIVPYNQDMAENAWVEEDERPSNAERHRAAVELIQRKVAERKAVRESNSHYQKLQEQELPEIPPVYNPQPFQNDGYVKDSGQGSGYKYNPYGEPVYGKTDRPNYIPKQRVVHFDLKGAPPKPSVYKTLIPWIAHQGATAVLMEYEDMFPYDGPLSSIAATNHYSAKDILEIVALCKKNNLEVIPLVPTFGHMEFVLKLEKFAHLREVPELPPGICPSLNESVWLVRTMIDQVMKLHPGSTYLHIGCDELLQLGECERCRLIARDTLFLQHVVSTAKYAKTKYNVIPIIWHDMLQHISELTLKESKIGEYADLMIWVYAEDIYRFVQQSVFTKFGEIFKNVWASSSVKGAFGEQLTVPNVRRHLDNNLNWLDVMFAESPKFSGGFKGIVLAAWQRYDHFAALCELLPSSIPSLAVNLLTVSHGYFNSSLQGELYDALGCMQTPKYHTWLDLDSDPFLWEKFSWCFFPGSQVFKMTARLDSTRRDVNAYIDRVTHSRAWITRYNRRHNFSNPTRVDEDLEEMPGRIHSVTLLLKTTREALSEWFDDWTVGEWLELHVWPLLNRLQMLQEEAESLKRRKHWPPRPLPLLPGLVAYGVSEPSQSGDGLHNQVVETIEDNKDAT